MQYFTDRFTNDLGAPAAAIRWLFDAAYEYQKTYGAAKMIDGVSAADGLLREICADVLLTWTPVGTDIEQIRILEGLQEKTIGVQIRALDEDGNVSASAHYVTAVGVVIDTAAASVADQFKALIIADSDNNAIPTNAKAQDEQKTQDKILRPNSYTAYAMDLVTGAGGLPYWVLKDYNVWGNAAISGLVSMGNYSAEAVETATEKDGTKDAAHDPDLRMSAASMTGGSEEGQKTVYGTEETVSASITLKNQGAASFKANTVTIRLTVKNVKTGKTETL